MSEIYSKSLLRSWFNKIVQHPSFIDTLNEYQKSELLQYCKDEVINNYKLASQELLKNISTNELVYKISTTNEAINILNLLGWNWLPEKGFYKIEEPEPEFKEIIFDSSVIDTLFDFLKNYIPIDQHSDLNLLLEGKSILGRINFQYKQNQLADIFYRLHQNGFIQTTRENTKNWLVKYFNWLDSDNNFRFCNYHSLTDSFSPSKPKKRPYENEAIANKIDLLKT